MGLCKCPKKKVTNLFCFEHRVNVCEHCLVSNHPKCIVQSYLQWLQDSDYDPACRLCGQNLGEGDGDCVRLTCYDVYHWGCLDTYARTMPANTAPAGYTCPTCKSGIFPASNVVSPVADALRQILSKVNWARAGLGLPLIEERPVPPTEGAVSSQHTPQDQTQNTSHHQAQPPAAAPAPAPAYHQVQGTPAEPAQPSPPAYTTNPQSVVSMDDATPYSRGMEKNDLNPRKLFDSTGGDQMNVSHDHDEDKYKRRPAFQWFFQWFKSNTNPRRRQDPNAALKRTAVLLILGLLILLTLVVIFTRVGRASADKDPFLDPMANPNIKVGNN